MSFLEPISGRYGPLRESFDLHNHWVSQASAYFGSNLGSRSDRGIVQLNFNDCFGPIFRIFVALIT
jgi:hypothetical protein